jgi:hypothetical protein
VRTVAGRDGLVMELRHAEPVGDVDDVVEQGAGVVPVTGRIPLEQHLRVQYSVRATSGGKLAARSSSAAEV